MRCGKSIIKRCGSTLLASIRKTGRKWLLFTMEITEFFTEDTETRFVNLCVLRAVSVFSVVKAITAKQPI